MKKIISYIVCFIFIFNIFCFSVFASTLDDDVFRKNSNGQYYLVDSSYLPSGMHFFFKYADGKAWYCTNYEMFTRVTNNFGLVVKPSEIPSLVTSWIGYLSNGTFKNGREVVNGSTVVGYAVNDISGCKLTNHGGTGGSFGVPSDLVNETHDFCEDETSVIPPDFINLPVISWADANNPNFYGYSHNEATETYLGTYQDKKYIFSYFRRYRNGTNSGGLCASIPSVGSTNNVNTCCFSDDISFSVNSNLFTSLVSTFGLSSNKTNIDIISWEINPVSNSKLTFYNDNFEIVTLSGSDVNYYGYVSSYQSSLDYAYCLPVSKTKSILTLYSDISIPSQIYNNNYSPTFIFSNTYTNFDNSANNEFNSSVTQISNSTSNNETIYNNSKTEINQNIKNNNYEYNTDNSSTIVNNIINNYYGDSGGSGGDDNNDDNWWDSIISAIGGFFEGLGRIVAEIIAGIIGIFTDVLNMIADLQVDITALQDFFQQIFGFFPPEIVSLISVSIGLMILICIIKALK